MAIDSRDKRQSAHRASGGYGLPNPDGSVDTNDRQHLLGYYGGVVTGAVVIWTEQVPGTATWTEQVPGSTTWTEQVPSSTTWTGQ